jgi:outer membrane translocation and assembly module TamA
MRAISVLRLFVVIALTSASTINASAQEPEPTSREGAIEQEQADKAKTLHPYVISTGEKWAAKAEVLLTPGAVKFHPFFDSAYRGGGFTLGAGYSQFVSPYNYLDVRGSYSILNYKRAEAEFVTPQLFHRRGSLSLLGGWREATQVGFFGLGMQTSSNNRVNYGFQQPYASALLTVKPTRRYMTLKGGFELSQWKQQSGEGSYPTIETKYTPETLPGLGAQPTYLHSQGTFGFDWRTTPGYSRRGGFYGVTWHDFHDQDGAFGFNQTDWDVIQHFPILREAWVISLHGLASTTHKKGGQDIPFFMLPSLGGGSDLRGYSSWRYRDRNSLLLQAEWRIMVNRFLDTAFFYDAGKVTEHTRDLSFDGLKSDFGFGVRFHGPFATPLRIEVAKSTEGFHLIFSSSAVF